MITPYPIENLSFPCILRRSPKVKSIRIQISIENVEIVAPFTSSLITISQFVEEKKTWIFKHCEKFLQKRAKFNLHWPKALENHERLPLQGNWVELSIHSFDKASNKRVDLIHQDSQPSILKVAPKKADKLWNTLKAWYQQQALALVEIYVQKYCPLLGLWPTRASVKQQKSRWGSCGIHNEIHINWILVIAPPDILEYVVVHELCHLKYRSHGVRFWGLVEKLFPNYSACEEWLRHYGGLLAPPEAYATNENWRAREESNL